MPLWHSLCSSTLLVRLLFLAYPRDQCLGLNSTFNLLPILVFYLHPALWRVMTSKPTSTAWHHKLILQVESFRMSLNPQKSQYIWFGTRQQLDKLDLGALFLEFPSFVFSTSVQDLGVILDQELSFVEHITPLIRACFYYLHQLQVVSCSHSSSSTATLVHAFMVNF